MHKNVSIRAAKNKESLGESFYLELLRLRDYLSNCAMLKVPLVMRSKTMQKFSNVIFIINVLGSIF